MFFEQIFSGLTKAGWVIIPLVFVSFGGWYLIFHRGMVLQKLSGGPALKWRTALHAHDWESWLNGLSIRQQKTLTGATLKTLYNLRDEGREAMEAKLDELMKFGIPELEKSLSTLAIFAMAAPLMGLLGTVNGMVQTFQVISAFGTGNTALMSDSIAESLMATQNGLLVAFPLMIMHMRLTSKAEAIEKTTLSTAHALINRCFVSEIEMPENILGGRA